MARTCMMMSRWCDQSIHDTGHSDRPNGPFQGRPVGWNPCRGNHLGQRPWRTHRQAGHMDANDLIKRCQTPCGEGPSTYGSTPSCHARDWSRVGNYLQLYRLSIGYAAGGGQQARAWRSAPVALGARERITAGQDHPICVMIVNPIAWQSPLPQPHPGPGRQAEWVLLSDNGYQKEAPTGNL
jgi:hypothetical protein